MGADGVHVILSRRVCLYIYVYVHIYIYIRVYVYISVCTEKHHAYTCVYIYVLMRYKTGRRKERERERARAFYMPVCFLGFIAGAPSCSGLVLELSSRAYGLHNRRLVIFGGFCLKFVFIDPLWAWYHSPNTLCIKGSKHAEGSVGSDGVERLPAVSLFERRDFIGPFGEKSYGPLISIIATHIHAPKFLPRL